MSRSILAIRPIAPSEALFAAMGTYIGYSTRVSGHLDQAALTEAFRILQQTYPVLACKIGQHGTPDRYAIEPAADILPIVDCHQQGRTDEPLLGLPDPQGRTALIHTVQSAPDQAWVTLLTHHAIADGHHSLQLLADLWIFYTDTVEGRPMRPNRHGYPRSLEQLWSERGITADTRANPADAIPPSLHIIADPTGPEEFVTVRTRLTAAETKSLSAFGHRTNTTINGLVSAALLRATTEALDVGIGELAYWYAVDLRTRVTPALGYTEGTNVLSLAQFVADADTGTDMATLARAITDKFTRDLAAGEIQRLALRVTELIDPLAVDILSTNWGKVPPLRTPRNLTFEDFRATGHTTNPRLTQAIYPNGIYTISTFDSQLTIDNTAMPGTSVPTDRIHALLTDLPH